ncbi:KdsC family phosphatase [Salegentibacter salegens]|uniref:3-deoxy-D-manno-octulosonate 8-phosphate phosphatase (KDO 8-P phosphatase) n=1 Tax=Salegentibacter salegens TaxID=143223 RepID=A0A1M7HF32_9FLAO|nr:HAD hydrolase family protein [Salegentibacter salegens]PRX43485.1 3-deoxy-D-manno-octulosonate 8-phosphate phosphatase (KDO 8-P phosphatase) [Salegentibacter salegens]SHM26747.1 3-deoxy-D-manno-octulosonate 8-phosphate phosphatase (KDO 8-P phosphatase) [Salegentibacter salegens]
MKYKLVVSDVDGVWTDGSFYYSSEGDVIRKFSTKDSYGISLCRLANIPVLILSSEKNMMVEKRMKKLKLRYVELGRKNKLKVISSYCNKMNIELSEVAYIGDDMNDFPLIGKVGFFACPEDAYYGIRKAANSVLKKKGGNGAFREFVEVILEKSGDLEETYAKYINECLQTQE